MKNKKINCNLSILVVLVIIFISCEKSELRLTETFLPTDQAFVRFNLHSPNTLGSVAIKINDQKINGNLTSPISGVFPAVVNTPEYAAVPVGSNFKLSILRTASLTDSVLLFSSNLQLEKNKFYSVYLADTFSTRSLFILEDNDASLVDTAFVKLRLVNAMPNTALSFIEIDSLNPTSVKRDTLSRNIAFKSSSGFLTVPLRNPTNAPLRFRIVSSSTGATVASFNPTVAYATAGTFSAGRSMTITISGFLGGTSPYSPSLQSTIYNK